MCKRLHDCRHSGSFYRGFLRMLSRYRSMSSRACRTVCSANSLSQAASPLGDAVVAVLRLDPAALAGYVTAVERPRYHALSGRRNGVADRM